MLEERGELLTETANMVDKSKPSSMKLVVKNLPPNMEEAEFLMVSQ